MNSVLGKLELHCHPGHAIWNFGQRLCGQAILDALLVASIVAVFTLVACSRPGRSEWRNWLKADARSHLGGEYDEIAHGLRSGRGFSDPFGLPTGPTAWMPPAIPYFLAGIYALTNDNREIVWRTIVSLQTIIVWFSGLTVVRAGRRIGQSLAAYVVLVSAIAANFHELFQKTHDVWLNLLLIQLLWLGAAALWCGTNRTWLACGWGAFGGFTALCSPIIAATWALLTSARWIHQAFRRRSERPVAAPLSLNLLLATGVSLAVVLPWTARNLLVFGRLVPIKSNGMFEVWQSLCLDDDGVLDSQTTGEHPWLSNGSIRAKYMELGENGFSDYCGREVRRSLAEYPLDALLRVNNRFVAATLIYRDHDLNDANIYWPTVYKRTVFPLTIASIALMFAVRRPWSPDMLAAVTIYLLVLSPYVLISYYDRYAAPLVGMKMLIVLYGWDTFVSIVGWRKESTRRVTGREVSGSTNASIEGRDSPVGQD